MASRPTSPELRAPHGAQLPPTQPCDVCGSHTFEARCEIICRRCGYKRDCSDP